jgi:hypothetical protein
LALLGGGGGDDDDSGAVYRIAKIWDSDDALCLLLLCWFAVGAAR